MPAVSRTVGVLAPRRLLQEYQGKRETTQYRCLLLGEEPPGPRWCAGGEGDPLWTDYKDA
jgi:hypothetical protein